MKNKRISKIMVGVSTALILTVVIYQMAYASTFQTSLFAATPKTSVQQIGATTASNTAVKEFTTATLKNFNGKNGQPAYIAIDGIVYDVTKLANWSSGSHHGVIAGAEVTQAFANSPHSKPILKKAVVVGKLVSQLSAPVTTTPTVTKPVATTTTTVVKPVTTTTTTVVKPVTTNTTTVVKPTTTTVTKTTTTSAATEVWTLEKLAKYNGKNGQPAYIAVSGVIYDVTKLANWSSGSHQGYSAGQDLTTAFANSPHSKSILNNAVVIGKLGSAVGNATTSTTVKPVTNNTAITNSSSNSRGDDNDRDDDDDDDDHGRSSSDEDYDDHGGNSDHDGDED